VHARVEPGLGLGGAALRRGRSGRAEQGGQGRARAQSGQRGGHGQQRGVEAGQDEQAQPAGVAGQQPRQAARPGAEQQAAGDAADRSPGQQRAGGPERVVVAGVGGEGDFGGGERDVDQGGSDEQLAQRG